MSMQQKSFSHMLRAMREGKPGFTVDQLMHASKQVRSDKELQRVKRELEKSLLDGGLASQQHAIGIVRTNKMVDFAGHLAYIVGRRGKADARSFAYNTLNLWLDNAVPNVVEELVRFDSIRPGNHFMLPLIMNLASKHQTKFRKSSLAVLADAKLHPISRAKFLTVGYWGRDTHSDYSSNEVKRASNTLNILIAETRVTVDQLFDLSVRRTEFSLPPSTAVVPEIHGNFILMRQILKTFPIEFDSKNEVFSLAMDSLMVELSQPALQIALMVRNVQSTEYLVSIVTGLAAVSS
ncbi:MAG: hypothetical protein V1492_04740, partial [Candidatus Micrarchaeota archaeon]